MDREHVLPLVTDYVLGLLPPEEQRRVERHAGDCPACRQAVNRERQVGQLVRHTVAAAQPPFRAQALRPRPPARAAIARERLYRQFAPAMMILMLLLGSVAMRLSAGGAELRGSGAVFLTSSSTPTLAPSKTPTATIAAATIGRPDPAAGLAPAPGTAPAPTNAGAGAVTTPVPGSARP